MGILQLPTPLPAQLGILPATKKMVTTDSLITLTTAGYLNAVNLESFPLAPSDILEVLYSFNQQTNTGVFGIFTVGITNGVITLTQADLTGNVILPTVANRLAVFEDTNGTIGDGTTMAVNAGGLQAGLATGTAGTFVSYSSTGSKGSLIVAAVANTGNTNTTISNVAMGQASVVSIPDPANAIGRFLVGATATPFVSGNIPAASGTGGLMVDSGKSAASLPTFTSPTIANHIAVFTNTSGNLGEDAATAINLGNIQAGNDSVKGQLLAFGGSANGSIIINPIGNTGNTSITIQNAVYGQATVLTIPDPGAATGKFLLDSGTQAMTAGSQINLDKVSAAESGNAVTASGQAGYITTSSLTTVGGGTYAITWTNTHITATSVINLTIQGGSNNATNNITFTCVAGSGSAVLTIYNNTAATALNGTLIIGYSVF